jgi:hypothetical protein
MKALKISQPDQYQHEVLTWERALEFYKQENAFLKTRLSQVLDQPQGASFLDAAELFNTRFLFADELLSSLMQDIRQQKELLQRSSNGDHTHDKPVQKYQHKLRAEMEKLEIDLSTLKQEFNQQLLKLTDIS